MVIRQSLIWIAWLLILVPLSVDNYWNIPFGDYDLRLNYFGAALALLIILFESLRRKSLKSQLLTFFSNRFVQSFLAMAAVGILGMLQSSYPRRAAMFWVWSIGTLLGVPFLCAGMVDRLGKWIPRTLLTYGALQAVILIIDAMACIPSDGRYHLGRVMIYSFLGDQILCRPHVWYQEPGYFCAFALLLIILTQRFLSTELDRSWRLLFKAAYFLILSAVILSTSRLGWLGAAILIAFDAARAIRKSKRPGIMSRARRNPRVLLLVSGVALAIGAFIGSGRIYNYVGSGLVNPTTDPSFVHRYFRLEKAWLVFKDHPWFGSGPGTAGAQLVDHHPSDPWLTTMSASEKEKIRRDPLSQNLYTELLSEWGALGTIFFLFGIYWMFIGHPPAERAKIWIILGLIYLSTQTLPRFDLWLMLSILWAIPGRTRQGSIA